MKKLILILGILIISNLMVGQENLFAFKNFDYQEYVVVDREGNHLFSLPLHAEPISSGVMRSGFYPNSLLIPLKNGTFPVRFLGKFYLVHKDGHVIQKMHPQTEWVHPFKGEIARIPLMHYPKEGEWRDMYINVSGEVLFDGEIFLDGDDFYDGYAPVRSKKDKQWRIIDGEGREIMNLSKHLKGEPENIYFAYNKIWTYNSTEDYAQWYINIYGEQSKDLLSLIQKTSDLIIPKSLVGISSNFLRINSFLKSDRAYIFLMIKNEEGGIEQNLYNRELVKVDTAKPFKDAKIKNTIISNSNYGCFSYVRAHDETNEKYCVIDFNTNKVVALSEHIISKIDFNSILIKENENFVLKDFNNNVLFTIDKEIEREKIVTLEAPIEKDFKELVGKEKMETLIIKGFGGEYLPPSIFSEFKNLKTLVLLECRELIDLSTDLKQFSKIENLVIKRCNKLKKYRPDTTILLGLETILTRFEAKSLKEKELYFIK